MDGRKYPSDLTDEQWQLIEPLLPPPSRVGGPRRICRRRIMNAILYVNRTGCQWRQLPSDFPNWKTVYHLFWLWQLWDLWQEIHDCAVPATASCRGKKAHSQCRDHRQPKRENHGSRRNSGLRCRQKVSGRKRHLVVDTLGLILAVVVHGPRCKIRMVPGCCWNGCAKALAV